MSSFVFEWTRTVISQQYLDSMLVECNADKHNIIKELASKTKVKVEFNNKGQIFLEGGWEQILNIQILLVKFLELPEEEKISKDHNEHAAPSLSPLSDSSATKTKSNSVVCCIRQKYLNASRRRNEVQLQKYSVSQCKKSAPQVEEVVCPAETQENEVYVNITMSTDFSKISGILLPITSVDEQSLGQLPYQVPVLESSGLVSTDGVLINTEELFAERAVTISTVNSDTGQEMRSVSEHKCGSVSVVPIQTTELRNKGNTQKCSNQLGSVNDKEVFLDGNINLAEDSAAWESDSESVLYSMSNNEVATRKSEVNGSHKATKKKDYEKLAPFKFFCKVCSFKSKRESHYQRHLELHSKVSELFSCKKCDFTTIRLGHLRRHEMSHSDTKFACTMCNYHTDHHKFLLRHQRLKHCNIQGRKNSVKKEVLRCAQCGYNTTRPYFYQRHLHSHANPHSALMKDEHRFQCQQCSYKTGRKEHYIRHVNNVHINKRPYLCDHCGKAFKRPDALKQHHVTHVELDPSLGAFRCPVCGKCCRAQAQLTQHLAVHSNVRSFLCEICGSSFKTRAVQRKHVLTIHKNPKAFACSQCSRKFNTKYALRRHMKQHCLDKKRKSDSNVKTNTSVMQVVPLESDCAVPVIQSEPILIQEAPRTQLSDNQTAITVQVIGFVQPYSDT